MKKITTLLMIVLFSPFNFNSLNSLAAEPSETLTAYFQALKDGDVGKIKQCIAGDFYEKNKVLLENNPDYPEFLRNYYQGADLEIGKSVKSGDTVIIEMRTLFPNGSTGVNKLRLKESSDGDWKIVEEIFD
ncbi:MAG TPA: hypothetical protein VNN20_16685 [Thermodesulfobacteriota bacterium]|nr:hypothetical protein [Thermodesulfobacteriota bacterium]